MMSCVFLVYLFLIVYTVGDTDCDETLECASEDVNGTTVYCWGYKSCADSYITADSVGCDGKVACFGATLDVTGSGSCEGSDSCALAQINTTGNMYCGGYWSCAGATINSGGVVECPGEEGCRYSDIEEADSGIYCFGDYGCRNTKITGVSEVYSRGYRGTYFADIDTTGVDDFSISFDGYFAGYETHIYCAQGSTCNIDCEQSTSCFGVTLYCVGDCIVDCDSDCDYECPDEIDYTNSSFTYMHKTWDSLRESRETLRVSHQKEFGLLLDELNDKGDKINHEEKELKMFKFNEKVENDMEKWKVNFQEINKLNKYNINNNKKYNIIKPIKLSSSSSTSYSSYLNKTVLIALSLILNGVFMFVFMFKKYKNNKNGEEGYPLLK